MDSSGIVNIVKTNDKTTESVGTGFFVGEMGLLLTCYHVVNDAGCYNASKPVKFKFEGKAQVFSALLGEFDPTNDVAILYAEKIKPKGYSLSKSGEENDKFDTRGFPAGSLTGVSAHPSYEIEAPDGLVELKEANCICRGFSGAPLLDKNGSVAGIIRQVPTTLRAEGSLLSVARAIPIEAVLKLFPDRLSDIQTASPVAPLVPPKSSDSDWQSLELDDLAGQTFSELMCIWLDKTEVKDLSRLNSESQEHEYVVEFPSLSQGMSSLRTLWQIKSSATSFSRHYNIMLNSNCFHLELLKEEIDAIRNSMQPNEHFYMAFAHNSSGTDLNNLRRLAPRRRFDWYCIDLSQQFKNEEPYIIIPEQNKLNLSTLSLLWSSIWVEKAYSPLSSRIILETPRLSEIINRVFPQKGENDTSLGWENLSKRLQEFESEIGKDELSRISLPLAIGTLIGDITKTLCEKSSDLDTIQTYCPESLYGNANFWLFDKSYRKFMCASGWVVDPDRHGNNLRILPLPDEPENISDLVKACLWHVMLLYATLNVEVRIIYCPSLEAGADHSYYGGGIDYFPWLSISNDGVTFMIEKSMNATGGQHRDFINQYMNDIYISPTSGDIFSASVELKLEADELITAPKCPVLLFPKEDRFIGYPTQIFGNGALSSIQLLKQKLS